MWVQAIDAAWSVRAAGVLNTDNMSILGLTIDYGPYAFMDRSASAHQFPKKCYVAYVPRTCL